MVESLVAQLALIFAFSVAALLLFHRLGLPPLIGFILAGVVIGPHGTRLVSAAAEVEQLAEIGVILLLFTIGLELSLKRLRRAGGPVLVAGSIQILGTIGVVSGVLWAAWGQGASAVFFGFLVALSSTAIVLRSLQDAGDVDSPHGQVAVAILILQDLAVVPMMLFTPVLAGRQGQVGQALLGLVAVVVVLVALVYIAGKWLVPKVLYEVARTRSRELFLLVIVGLAVGVAWATSAAGLSLSIGAFLAGLVLGQSEYAHDALENVLPLRNVFASFFFVSIGMLLDLQFLVENPFLVAGALVGVLLLKTAVATTGVLVAGFSARTAVLSGMAVGQVGEFSFILSRVGLQEGLISADLYQLFLDTAVLSMAVTPVMLAVAGPLARWAGALPVAPGQNRHEDALAAEPPQLNDHLIIVGYGLNGQHAARFAKEADIPHIILDTNPEGVRRAKRDGEPIVWGDAANPMVLRHAGIDRARVAVVAISDAAATRAATVAIRRHNPRVLIIVRARYVDEIRPLLALGADEVVSQEFETSVEVLTRVLDRYHVPAPEIEEFVQRIRGDGYRMMRGVPERRGRLDIHRTLPGVDVQTVRVARDSPLAGQSLIEAALRSRFDVTVLATRRGPVTITVPRPDQDRFEVGDLLILMGTPEDLARAGEYVSPSAADA